LLKNSASASGSDALHIDSLFSSKRAPSTPKRERAGMTYTESDYETTQSIHDDKRRKAKETIAKFLENDLYTMDKRGMDRETGEDKLAILLLAIDFLRDELLAWARKEQA
jgi:hypothetical protein